MLTSGWSILSEGDPSILSACLIKFNVRQSVNIIYV